MSKTINKFRPVDKDGNLLELSSVDQIYFTMKKTEKGKAMIKKTIGNGINLEDDNYYHITLETEDTRELEAGSYVYDIELDIVSSNRTFVQTLIEGTIELLQDVTSKEDY